MSNVLDAIERRDWGRLRLLHPDVQWTTAAEDDLRGRREMIARLSRTYYARRGARLGVRPFGFVRLHG